MPHLPGGGADGSPMTATVALRHQERPLGATRAWTGSRLAETSRLAKPALRQVRRLTDEDGPGTEIEVVHHEQHALLVVARLWLGVLSIFALIVFLGLILVILGAWAFGFQPVVVTSGSMSPTVRTGDVVITKPVGIGDKVGNQTVINFDDPATLERRLHRVIEVTPQGYRTKGDANADPDPQLVPQDHVEGAGFILAPFVGYLAVWAQEGDWAPLAGAGLILVSLAVMSRRSWMWAGGQR